MKILRSLLYSPGNRPQLMEKAPGYGADAVIFDLEDAVPQAQKAEARAITREYLQRLGRENVIYVRVNALHTGQLEADLEAVVVEGLAGVKLPKADRPETVRRADAMIAALERERGLPLGSVELSVTIESAYALEFAYDLLSASPRVGSVTISTAEDGDLQTDLGCLSSPDGIELLYARSKVVAAARAAGVEWPLDGIYADFRDEVGLLAQARMARRLGFRGKQVIHPRQVEPVNRVFSPSERELDYYRRVLAALEAAEAEGSASTTVDGKMVDIAMAANARRALAWAEALGRRG